MDELDREILNTEQERAELARRLERLDIKLEDLRLAATLRPPSAPLSAGNGAAEPQNQAPLQQPTTNASTSRVGRQPGKLSKPYAGLLGQLAANSTKVYTTYEISGLARTFGIRLETKRIGDRMRRLATMGLVENLGGGRFRVTGEMARRANGGIGA